MSNKDEVEVEFVEVEAETEKALLVSGNSIGKAWIPRSQLGEECVLTEKGDCGDLYVKRWLAEDRGWV